MRAVVIAAAALVYAGGVHAAAPQISGQPLANTNKTNEGQIITVPMHPNVVASITTFPPGAETPVHKHPYPHYVYVMEGTLTVTNLETDKKFEAKQVQFVIEMMNVWHKGKNEGTTPVKLLVIDQLPNGVASNISSKRCKCQ
jgi:quercetin dioxygenase-like cupin family protein